MNLYRFWDLAPGDDKDVFRYYSAILGNPRRLGLRRFWLSEFLISYHQVP